MPLREITKPVTPEFLKPLKEFAHLDDEAKKAYLSQLGKRIQLYWGTDYPKHIIRTFSEIKQLIGFDKEGKEADAKGLAITIRNEDNRQRVYLDIEPYDGDPDKIGGSSGVQPFVVEIEVLLDMLTHFALNVPGPNSRVVDSRQALGLDFCIGKGSIEQEKDNYFLIIQVVDLCHNRIIDDKFLPMAVPMFSELIS